MASAIGDRGGGEAMFDLVLPYWLLGRGPIVSTHSDH
ncbi:Uncharacterised protein [Mycobacteroides abscessus subsp. abscessus]|nr:Uncharacterised protein [Mycobacteroides abscessus subsp. abscessus]